MEYKILWEKYKKMFKSVISFINQYWKRRTFKKRNPGAALGHGVHLKFINNITMGSGSYINSGYIFASEKAKIIIGEGCMLSYNVHLRTDMHNHARTDIPMKEQGCTEKDIIIEDDVWVGFGAQIMSGCRVGKGSIVAAGAVVTRDVAPYTVVGGVPARFIKNR